MRHLTPKQQRFVQEYLIDLNASAAAERAGYSPKTCEVIGHQLLKKTLVASAISEAQAERVKRTGITQDYVLNSLKKIADRCMQEEAVLDQEGSPTGLFRFDAGGANKSLELLGKHLKLFTDKLEHTGEGGGPVRFIVEG